MLDQFSNKNVEFCPKYYTMSFIGGLKMIICNLAVLLAQRQLKITRVSNDTGISRTTLTALNQNESKGVQFETINALCQYLKVNPSNFFQYLPFDVSCNTVITKNDTSFTNEMMESIEIKKNDISFDFFIKIGGYETGFKTFGYSGSNIIDRTFWGETMCIELEKEDNNNFSEIWSKKITPDFQTILLKKFKKSIADAINNSMIKKFSFSLDEPALLQIETKKIDITSDFYTDFDGLPF